MRTRCSFPAIALRTARGPLATLMIVVAVVGTSCVHTTREPMRRADMLVKVPGAKAPVTVSDIRNATYGVLYSRAGNVRQSTYNVAYVMSGGRASIITGETGFRDVKLTSTGMPERVKDYLEMSPIRGIIGARRTFTVGQTYDSVMLRPEGRPHFRYTCDREETVGGIKGYHLVVTSVRYGTTEMELVVSPRFPFPLYVKEHTGQHPISIILSRTGTAAVS